MENDDGELGDSTASSARERSKSGRVQVLEQTRRMRGPFFLVGEAERRLAFFILVR